LLAATDKAGKRSRIWPVRCIYWNIKNE